LSRLNDLIRQLQQSNPALADDIRREVAALADRRSFGLNFERHVPETVELPGRKVRKGDKVRVLPPRGSAGAGDDRLWKVTSIDRATEGDRAARLLLLPDHDETSVASLDDLVVVAEFRDPIYPGLVSTGRLEYGGDIPFHSVINAENYHALQSLLFTHRDNIDCVYIDPPYNTGSDDWIYNDRYVGGDDLYRHSKWLAFMERRLILARDLLGSTGVLVVAIGDDEHHRLRILLDQVFGAENFLANITWQGITKSDSRFGGQGADYMLCYGRDVQALIQANVRWKDAKKGFNEILDAVQRSWEDSHHDPAVATKLYRSWFKSSQMEFDKSTKLFDSIDETGRLYQKVSIGSPSPRPNLQYQVLHPVTQRPVPMPNNGWAVNVETMAQRISAGLIVFGEDETKTPRRKSYFDELATQEPRMVFEQGRSRASGHVAKLLGDRRFPNPKDHEVLMRWLSMLAPRDATILDFFGGSGSTLEAVIRLNSRDHGTRRCILVTNNEVGSKEIKTLTKAGYRHGDAEWEAKGVHEYVTKPRITSVVTGVKPDGSTHDDTVAANVEFFTLTYEAPLRVQSHREFERIAPLLWMRAGSVGRRIDALPGGWDVADSYGVLSDLDQTEEFVKALGEQTDARLAFVVTDEDRLFESVVRDLPDHVEPVRLYEAYLRNFEIESGRGTR
jgi:adenine-specific DNA-methyltransferase